MSEWMPIETAPKDGTEVIIFASWDWDDMEGERCSLDPSPRVASWDMAEYRTGFWSVSDNPYSDKAVRATHWMPLPEPPK